MPERLGTIVCSECGRQDEGERGWKAFLGSSLEGVAAGDPPEALLFCPDCAEREFGGDDA